MRFASGIRSAALLAVVAVGAFSGLGAAPAGVTQATLVPQDTCFLGFIGCSPAPAPTALPTPTPSATSGLPVLPLPTALPTPLANPLPPVAPQLAPVLSPTPTPSPSPSPIPVLAPADPGAMPLTRNPAKLSGSTLSISGLKGLGVVTVTLPDGSSMRVIKLEADHVSIDGFVLDAAGPDGHGVLTHATNMTADGSVVVYLDSIAGLLGSGASAVFDAVTPPTASDLGGLTALTLDLYGLSADVDTLTGSHEELH
ncbi:hypothetical protein KPL76_07605 [Subtercola sp. PAMC28395]|uniref:hypothetical protein n=1 Tax=Subtercola sp. PAMC28395 TaxID=2846775 RepID=UPI001C0CF4C3|nr:hypothetical protein [Subtercola sp. PAMC28395]QWT22680.1 hypothetical protein KPL76_07605 [Subtercola sp. PAMC28395]